jgi:hypothetical protein
VLFGELTGTKLVIRFDIRDLHSHGCVYMDYMRRHSISIYLGGGLVAVCGGLVAVWWPESIHALHLSFFRIVSARLWMISWSNLTLRPTTRILRRFMRFFSLRSPFVLGSSIVVLLA